MKFLRIIWHYLIILNHSRKNIDLIENNSEDIKDAVRDMLELMDNNYELDDKKNFYMHNIGAYF